MKPRRSRRAAPGARGRLDPRLRVALVLTLAGLALTALGLALVPDAAPGEGGLLARRGPAVARFDEANGTTVAVLYCGHWRCGPAFTVDGDAREALAGPRVYLRAGGPGAWDLVPIAPLDVPDAPEDVTEAYAGPFTVASAGPRLLPLVTGPLLVATGIGFALRREGRLAPAWTTLGGAAGVAGGTLGASAGEGGLFVLLLAFVVGMAGVALLLFRRTRAAGVALAVAGALAMFLTLVASRWFPTAPAL